MNSNKDPHLFLKKWFFICYSFFVSSIQRKDAGTKITEENMQIYAKITPIISPFNELFYVYILITPHITKSKYPSIVIVMMLLKNRELISL